MLVFLLSNRVAATATRTMTAAPMTRYVVVGAPLVGGITAGLGEGDAVCVVIAVGAVVGIAVGDAVGDGWAAGALPTPMAVSADDSQ